MAYAFEVRVTGPLRAAVVRAGVAAGGVADALAAVVPELEAALAEQDVTAAGPPFVRWLDPAADASGGPVEVELGVPVDRQVRASGRVEPAELPGGEVLVTWHPGPVDETGPAHAAAEDWLEGEGRCAASGPWEVPVGVPGGEGGTEVVYPLV